jgi:hypothetical protein
MFVKHAFVGVVLATSTMAQAALVHQYRSENYNAATGVWTDSAGSKNLTNPNATRPSLQTNATPMGQSAVVFDRTAGFGDGGRYLEISGSLNAAAFTSAPNFAFFAVLQSNDNSFQQIVSGNNTGDLQFRINNVGAGGGVTAGGRNAFDTGTTTSSILGTDFVVIAFTYNGSNWAWYIDGTAAGSGSASHTFNAADLIGTGSGISNSLVGRVAELRFYDNASVDVVAISNELRGTYIIPEPASLALFAVGTMLMLARRRA